MAKENLIIAYFISSKGADVDLVIRERGTGISMTMLGCLLVLFYLSFGCVYPLYRWDSQIPRK